MHSKHIIHRDIKSGNLLLTSDGAVKLADFGVSALTSASTNYRAHSFIGTPYWMAPEVILAENEPSQMYDCKADIWSAAIMAIELADKNPPMSDIHPMRALRLIPDANPQIFMVRNPKKWSKPFINYLQSSLIKNPRTRPAADEILRHPFFERLHSMSSSGGTNQIVVNLINYVSSERQARSMSGAKAAPPKSQQQQQHANEVYDDADDEFDFEMASTQASAPTAAPSQAQAPAQSQQQSSKSVASNNNASPARSPPVEAPKAGEVTERTLAVEEAPASNTPDTQPGKLASFFGRLSFSKRARSVTGDGIMLDDASKDEVPSIEDVTEKLGKQAPRNLYCLVELKLHLRHEVYGADLVTFKGPQNQQLAFLLLGTDKGLLAADITFHYMGQQNPVYNYLDGGPRVRTLLGRTRFRDIQVLEDYDVCLMLCGRLNNNIRMHQLDSLKRLISFVFGFGELPKVTVQSLVPSSDHLAIGNSSPTTPTEWAKDFVHLLNTRDALSFMIKRTQSTIFMGVLFKNEITVFEWAKLPYLQFMKVKAFWTPEQAMFFDLVHDGHRVRELIVVYEKEGSCIDFESSKVKDILVPPELSLDAQPKEIRKKSNQSCWQSWIQLKLNEETETKKGSEKQVVSWYNTMKNMKPKADSPTAANAHLFATFGAKSTIANSVGKVVSEVGKVYNWSSFIKADGKEVDGMLPSAPRKITVTPSHSVVGVHKNYIEVLGYKDASLVQVFKTSGRFRALAPILGCEYLDRRRGRVILTAYDKRSKKGQLVWLRECGFDLQSDQAAWDTQDQAERPVKVLGTAAIY